MIKTLLLLPLLLTPVSADTLITRSICDEMYDVLQESVITGDLSSSDAASIYGRCLEVIRTQ